MAGRIPKVVVVGPVAVDIAVRCGSFPQAGEVVEGVGFSCIPTGAGFNGAIQAAICGCEVNLLAKVGDDAFGGMIRKGLEQRGVKTDFVYTAQAMNTGVAVTMVDSIGENMGCVSTGSNRALSGDEIACASAEQLIGAADICLVCGDIPQEAAVNAIRMSKLCRTKVILQVPLTAKDEVDISKLSWPIEFFSADVLIPDFRNGISMPESGASGVHKAKLAAAELVARGVSSVVVRTIGKGCFIVDRHGALHVPNLLSERLVEQGCCSDIFAGALAASCGTGDRCLEAVKFASAACELAAVKFGSGELFVSKEEIIELLQNQRD